MKVYLNTIGCRLNQSEIESYARQFRAAGHTLVSDAADADLTVVNTCTVTSAAAADSRKMLRGAARAGSKQVIATGCWATMEPLAAAGLSGVSSVVVNAEKDQLVPRLLQINPDAFDLEPVEREPIPGARLRTRAFIKVQDGCDNRCTFCITTVARGAGRSRAKEEILIDIQAAVAGGAQEVVLTGVHLGSWGQDFAEDSHLRDLITYLLEHSDAPRIRLSSLEPWDLDANFFALWQDRRLARHLHVPLQSGCAATLKRMARKTTPDDFAQLVQAARSAIPEVAITTDVIVGFPGESEAEFAESMAFVRQMNFAGGHVFSYSPRSGTAAARLPGHVEYAVRKARNAAMRALFEESARRYQRRFVGQELPVLWESATALGPDAWAMSGLTDNYLRVTAQAPRKLWNVITPVELVDSNEHALVGVIR